MKPNQSNFKELIYKKTHKQFKRTTWTDIIAGRTLAPVSISPMDCQSNVIGDGIRGKVRVIKDQLRHELRTMIELIE